MPKVFAVISDPSRLLQACTRRGLLKWVSDENYAKFVYRHRFGKELNLDNPQTFNDKIQWLKLYHRKPEFSMMADKYRVRQFVAERIGEQHLVPLLGVWNDADDIDFDKLPQQFVLKCNHDQGSVIICQDKSSLNIPAVRKRLNKRLKHNHYCETREWPYKDIKPCIICEEYLSNHADTGLIDYKVMCFHGIPKLIQVHKGRFNRHTQDFYDLQWNRLEIIQDLPISNEIMQKPVFLQEMLQFSEALSQGMPHIRIDWYYANERLYFSEATFYDASGFSGFVPEKWDVLLGSWLNLKELSEKL